MGYIPRMETMRPMKPKAKQSRVEIVFGSSPDGLFIDRLIVKPGLLAEEPTLRLFCERLVQIDRVTDDWPGPEAKRA